MSSHILIGVVYGGTWLLFAWSAYFYDRRRRAKRRKLKASMELRPARAFEAYLARRFEVDASKWVLVSPPDVKATTVRPAAAPSEERAAFRTKLHGLARDLHS